MIEIVLCVFMLMRKCEGNTQVHQEMTYFDSKLNLLGSTFQKVFAERLP